ncbi:redoxin family protein [Fusibacter bizertensis]
MKRNNLILIGLALIVVVAGVAIGLNQSKNNMESKDMMETTVAMQDDTTMMAEETMTTSEAMMAEETMMTDESVAEGSMDMMSNTGDLAPDFTLMNLNGDEVSLSSLKGEKVYVKFWASWCSICLAGLEELDQLAASDNDFKVITIVSPDFNGEQSKDDFITWFDTLEYKNIEVLLDENGTVAKSFGVRAYPTSAYIGSDSVLIKSLPGHVDNQTIGDTFKTIY